MKYIDFISFSIPDSRKIVKYMIRQNYSHLGIRLSGEDFIHHFYKKILKGTEDNIGNLYCVVKRKYISEEEYNCMLKYIKSLENRDYRYVSKKSLVLSFIMMAISNTPLRNLNRYLLNFQLKEDIHNCTSIWMLGLKESNITFSEEESRRLGISLAMSWKYGSVKSIVESNLETVFKGTARDYLREMQSED